MQFELQIKLQDPDQLGIYNVAEMRFSRCTGEPGFNPASALSEFLA